MAHKNALEIYDDLLASGMMPEEAHATAKAIADANRVSPEDLVKIREDFSHSMEILIQKVDINFRYMGGIGGAIFIAIIANMVLSWVKQ